MTDKITAHLSVSDVFQLQRLEKILKINSRRPLPLLVIIGAQTPQLARLFYNFIQTYFSIDFLIDFSQNINTQADLREILLLQKNKNIALYLFRKKSGSHSKISGIINKLQFHRDLIPRNNHKVFIICDIETYNQISHKAYDFFSYAQFAYIFYDNNLESKIEINSNIQRNYHKYKELFTQASNPHIKTFYRLQTAIWARRLGLYKESFDLLEQGLQYFENIKDKDEDILDLEAQYFLNLGKTFLHAGLPLKAIHYFNKAIKDFRHTLYEYNSPVKAKINQVNIRLARAYKDAGKIEQAHKILADAHEEAQKLDNPKGILMALSELTYLHITKAEYAKAKQTIDERQQFVNSLFSKPDNTLSQGYIYLDLGYLYNKQGKFVQSQTYFLKALDIFAKNKMSRLVAIVYYLLGTSSFKTFNTGKAFEYFSKSIKIAKEHQLVDIEAKSNAEISLIFFIRGLYRNSYEYSQKAYESSKVNLFFRGLSQSAFYQSIIFTHAKFFKLAKPKLRALKNPNFKEHAKSRILTSVAMALYYYKKDKYDVSIKFANNAIELSQKMNLIIYLVRAMYIKGENLYLLGKYEQSRQVLKKALDISYRYNFIEGIITTAYYYYFDRITPELSPKERLEHYQKLKELAESSDFTILLPRIYERIIALTGGGDTLYLTKKKQALENNLHQELESMKNYIFATKTS